MESSLKKSLNKDSQSVDFIPIQNTDTLAGMSKCIEVAKKQLDDLAKKKKTQLFFIEILNELSRRNELIEEIHIKEEIELKKLKSNTITYYNFIEKIPKDSNSYNDISKLESILSEEIEINKAIENISIKYNEEVRCIRDCDRRESLGFFGSRIQKSPPRYERLPPKNIRKEDLSIIEISSKNSKKNLLDIRTTICPKPVSSTSGQSQKINKLSTVNPCI